MQTKMSYKKMMINRTLFKGCFSLLGNRISCTQLPPEDDDGDSYYNNNNPKAAVASRKMVVTSATTRIIKSDGDVRIYRRPLKAWELMEEFPKHLVCRSDCFYIGEKTQALSQHDRLQPGHNYFLLPSTFFQSALSLAAFIRCCSRSASFSGRSLPLFQVEKTPWGSVRIKVSQEDYLNNTNQEDTTSSSILCTTPQLLKAYNQLVVRPHKWKPKLDTIAENKTRHKKKLPARRRRSRTKTTS